MDLLPIVSRNIADPARSGTGPSCRLQKLPKLSL
jgi:hypothetical protein